MNERISEIWDQAAKANALLRSGENSWETQKAFIEKFAELIVQRTLDIVEAHTEIFQSSEARAMVEHIKKSVKTDFGVEE